MKSLQSLSSLEPYWIYHQLGQPRFEEDIDVPDRQACPQQSREVAPPASPSLCTSDSRTLAAFVTTYHTFHELFAMKPTAKAACTLSLCLCLHLAGPSGVAWKSASPSQVVDAVVINTVDTMMSVVGEAGRGLSIQ